MGKEMIKKIKNYSEKRWCKKEGSESKSDDRKKKKKRMQTAVVGNSSKCHSGCRSIGK